MRPPTQEIAAAGIFSPAVGLVIVPFIGVPLDGQPVLRGGVGIDAKACTSLSPAINGRTAIGENLVAAIEELTVHSKSGIRSQETAVACADEIPRLRSAAAVGVDSLSVLGAPW